jgi:peptidoglycan/xylan/chitin deacetylase (PgdA/CDA1 family)
MPVHAHGAILLYHRIADDRMDPYGLCVSPNDFHEQMVLVRDRYAPRSLDELAGDLHANRLANRSVAITFDDGYLDNLTTASPILVSAGLPATFFATTQNLSEPQPYWWDVLALTHDRASPSLHDQLLHATIERRQELLAEVEIPKAIGSGAQALPRPMSAVELRTLASRPGHRIGVHTTHHLFLPSQPADICLSEMRDSKDALESCLDCSIDTIAYPFGGVTIEIARAAMSLGFTTGAAVDRRAVRPDSDAMRLPRIEIRSGMDLQQTLDEVFSGAAEA